MQANWRIISPSIKKRAAIDIIVSLESVGNLSILLRIITKNSSHVSMNRNINSFAPWAA
ncbi:hypothetical protein D3C84_1110860 [compost metagenome]